MQYARSSVRQRRGVLTQRRTASAGLDADDLNPGIAQERMKQTDGIGTAAHTSDDGIRQSAARLQDLRACLMTDDGLQLAHDIGIGMRTDCRPQQIVGSIRIHHPVAHRLVDRGTQRAITAVHGHDLRAQQSHAAHVRSLALHIERTHIHRTRHADARAGGGTGDAVLTGTGLRHDALRTQTSRQ
jgi:hypothetical protein